MKYWIIPSNSKKFRMEAALKANIVLSKIDDKKE